MTQIWTGVGSRKTPKFICDLMYHYATLQKGIFRSGGAGGPDDYFERGALNCRRDIFLPRKNMFGKHGPIYTYTYTDQQWKFAKKIAQDLYPILFPTLLIEQFMTRNVFEVLGVCHSKRTVNPSDYVICWTPDGCRTIKEYTYGVTGGTGMAIMVADKFDVPVYNMKRRKTLKQVVGYLRDRGVYVDDKQYYQHLQGSL